MKREEMVEDSEYIKGMIIGVVMSGRVDDIVRERYRMIQGDECVNCKYGEQTVVVDERDIT